MRIAARLAAALVAVLPGAPRAAELECVAQCQGMAERKELMEGLSAESCMLRLCHDEARKLYAQADYEKAITALDRIEARLSDSPAYQLDRGLVQYARGRFEESLAAFDQVLVREPDSLRASSQRAHALIRLQRYADARKEFERLLALPAARTEIQGLKTTSYLHGNLGALALMQDDAAGAKVQLEKALQLDAGNTLAATYLHRVLPEVEAKRLDGRGVWLMMNASEDAALFVLPRANTQLAELLQRSPQFAEAWFLQSDIQRSQGQFEACETALARAEQNLPKDPAVRAERLRCQLMRGVAKPEQAKPAIDELVRLGKDHPDNERIRNILIALSGG